MRKNILAGVLGFVMVLSLGFFISSKQKEVEEPVDAMPSFTLKTTEGKEVSLDNYHDKKIVLNFFTSWCPYCKEETKDLHMLIEKRDDVEILMINLTPWEQNIKDIDTFIEEENVTLPVLLDKDGLFIQMFQIQGTPFNVFLTPKKEVKYIIPGTMDYEGLELYLNNIES